MNTVVRAIGRHLSGHWTQLSQILPSASAFLFFSFPLPANLSCNFFSFFFFFFSNSYRVISRQKEKTEFVRLVSKNFFFYFILFSVLGSSSEPGSTRSPIRARACTYGNRYIQYAISLREQRCKLSIPLFFFFFRNNSTIIFSIKFTHGPWKAPMLSKTRSTSYM